MLGMHLSQPGFIYIVCRPFTKPTEQIQKFNETRDSRYIDQNKLDKSWLQYDRAYGSYEYLIKRTTSEKVLRDKTFRINSNS